MMSVCVVIPVYSNQIRSFEQISMDQCFRILGEHDIYFILPKRLESFIKNNKYVLANQAKYKTFDDHFFADIPAYNRLMKFNGLYESFLPYDFMLIHQLDAFVFKDELTAWCQKGYDNIGAPLFEGHDLALSSSPLVSLGNGGFCLRNVKKCYDVVTRFKKLEFTRTFDDENRPFYINFYRYIKHQLVYIYSGYPFQPIINEDLFWAEVIPHNFPDFKMPDIKEAMKFSFEVNPEVLFELNNHELPFGCHAWWKYNLGFWQKHINQFGYDIKVD
ncbi:hypothetical protein GJU39_11430 [Pedobacter petrophilus]|uniref:DUF5672 domain-containing protein n=1 Tax=Pedobacter petrophilus TaxID=1908241 RepID=A0A7K0G0F9_9SPHI|nr:DUF5672 family protein [Pedobacter petrophilus]MRX76699.1 hypothetical protein [Pedobacter petrophilus]